ncbi:MAG TPA: methyltransferase domain-containing protein [Panacibacter sp.]|nr:methyltransferase domain-containing protein [Panacibacter sp.]
MNISALITTLISFIIKPAKRTLIQLSYSLKGKTGLEVGGPSSFFGIRAYCPVYVFAKQVDGVNFSTSTVWEGSIAQGMNYKYANDKTGFQYIAEASNLQQITDNKYDFLLSCHSLEHVANPLLALKGWQRVIKPGALLILVLPDKNHTFDHNRPYTSFDHILADYYSNTDEHDATHFEEIYALHDLSMDPGTSKPEELKARTSDNFNNRCVHHHVYNLDVLGQMLLFFNFTIVYKQQAAPHHLVIVARK